MKLTLSLTLLCFACFSHAFSYTKQFTESELQNKLDAMMPLERKQQFITIVITDPVIDFHETSNELSMKANIAATAFGGIRGKGTTHISGSISYKPETGSFHLKNPKMLELTIENVKEQYQTQIKQIAQIAIANAMSTYPIYTLNDGDIKQKLAKSVLESVVVQDEKLLVNLKVF